VSTTTASTSQQDRGWVDELATYLGPGCFPATHDHLAATLIRRHAPSHLLWHLSVLPRTRDFHSMAELVEALDLGATPAAPGPAADLA
jgi:hypothetical protein